MSLYTRNAGSGAIIVDAGSAVMRASVAPGAIGEEKLVAVQSLSTPCGFLKPLRLQKQLSRFSTG